MIGGPENCFKYEFEEIICLNIAINLIDSAFNFQIFLRKNRWPPPTVLAKN